MAAVDWPLADAYKPVLADLRRRAPNLTRRTQMEDGPDRIRRVSTFRPHVFSDTFEIVAEEAAVLRRWIEEELDQGRLWFNMQIWTDGAYVWMEARLVARDDHLYELSPVDQKKMAVSLTYEVKALPVADDCAYLEASVGGASALTNVILDLDTAINTELGWVFGV